jgi:hypothetical protein
LAEDFRKEEQSDKAGEHCPVKNSVIVFSGSDLNYGE